METGTTLHCSYVLDVKQVEYYAQSQLNLLKLDGLICYASSIMANYIIIEYLFYMCKNKISTEIRD